MADDKPYRNRIELLQGTLDMLILQTLQWGPQHGHRNRAGDSSQLRRTVADRDRFTVPGYY
jgi:hypothetical protein